MGTKQSIFQPGHDGKSGSVAVHPGMVVSHASHGYGADMPAHGGDIARNSTRGKHINPTPVHPASHRVTGTNIGAPTATTLSAIPDASNPCATDPTKPGKSFVGKPVPTYPGQRSRTSPMASLQGDKPGLAHRVAASEATSRHARMHEIGNAVLNEAFAFAAPDDRAAHGRQR